MRFHLRHKSGTVRSMTELQDRLKSLHALTQSRPLRDTELPRELELQVALQRVYDVVAQLAQNQLVLATAVTQKLELREGDVLLVKLGDPAMGWIPAPEASTEVAELFRKAFEQAGVSNRVSVVLYNYALSAEVVSASDAPASDTPTP